MDHWDGSSGYWRFHAAPSGGEQGLQGSLLILLLTGAQTLQEKLPWKWQLQQRAESRTSLEGWKNKVTDRGPGDPGTEGVGSKPG